MIVLPSTSDIIRITASSTNAISIAVEYVDHTSSAYTPGRQLTALAAATLTTICAAPAASTQRNIKFMSLCAKGGANTIILETFDGTTAAQLIGGSTFAMAAGDTLQFVDCDGWRVVPAQGPGAGRLLGIQYINAGTTSITHTTGATSAVIEGVGGGGAGAGASATQSVGASGGSGTWGKKKVTLVGLASTCVVGVGGTGSTGTGGAGTDTTFTHNGVTMTLPKGNGGAALAGLGAVAGVAAGGAAASAATNADVSITGAAGGNGIKPVPGTSTMYCGAGGSNPLGQGGRDTVANATIAAGAAGTGFGSGSAGCHNGTGAGTQSAVNAQPGLLIIYDYA